MRPAYVSLAAAILLLPLFLCFAPARAATVIYYSAPENSYGWCAGYGHSRAQSCARKYCIDAGGTECKLAMECAGGWGAISFAQDPAVGVGIACDMGDATSARKAADVVCMIASRTFCWTDVAFSRNAKTLSAASNRDFDLTWYSQGMLNVRRYEAGSLDGSVGPQTRTAIQKFQADLQRPETGQLDDELFLRLVDAVEGGTEFAKLVKRDLYDPEEDLLATRTYSYASKPAPDRSYSEELAGRSEEAQRLALATMLSTSGNKCTLPALSAWTPTPDSQFWDVECVEGSFSLFLSGDSRVITHHGTGKPEANSETTVEPDQETQPEAAPEPQPASQSETISEPQPAEQITVPAPQGRIERSTKVRR